MIRFESDYLEGAHPRILEAVCRVNREQNPGYGVDDHCEAARVRLMALIRRPDADVHFLVGGTQTNATVIAAALRPHQGVVCAATGHIAVHESGAIEHSGHKVLTLPSDDGKITEAQVRVLVEAHYADATHEHMVQPGMLYISQPTENGTLYTLAELEALSELCRTKGMYLFVDGARLPFALAAPGNDATLPDLARLCDAFYVGGTKAGLLFGEALVLTHPALQKDFRYFIKQNGGMLAKGFLLGAQFDAFFQDNLFLEIGAHADRQAARLHDAFARCGFAFRYDSPTNQQFPILPDALLDRLARDFSFSEWMRIDDGHRAVRFCASWATTDEQVDALIQAIQ